MLLGGFVVLAVFCSSTHRPLPPNSTPHHHHQLAHPHPHLLLRPSHILSLLARSPPVYPFLPSCILSLASLLRACALLYTWLEILRRRVLTLPEFNNFPAAPFEAVLSLNLQPLVPSSSYTSFNHSKTSPVSPFTIRKKLITIVSTPSVSCGFSRRSADTPERPPQ